MASDYKIAIKIAGQLESSFTNAINQAQNGLNGLDMVAGAGKMLFKATTGSLALAGSAMAAFGGYAVKTGQEFESAMSSAAATAGATPEEFQKMHDAAREMGRATTKTAAESANALEYMALAGWDVDTSIQALPSVLKLSEASGMDLARTSDLVTDSMDALGVSVDDLPLYLDIATRAQNKSNQSAEQLMEAYLGVGGTMKNLGIPLEESATALGVMANRGIKGSEAGTALNAVMVNLTTGARQAGKMMEKLGISAFDDEGNFKGLEATLQEVNTAMSGMTEEERNATLAAIGGKTHIDALNNLMAGLNTTTADGRTEWAALTDELNDCSGALEDMAATKTDNFASDIERMKSAMADFGIEIYESGAGPLRDFAIFGQDAFNALREAYSEGGFSAMAETLGTKLSELAQKVIEMAPEFIEAAATLVESIITGIENNVDGIGQGAGKIITTLGQAIVRIAPRLLVVGAKLIVEIVRGIVENFPALADAAKQAVAYLWDAIKNAFTNAKDTLGDEAAAPLEKFLSVLPMVAGGFMAFAAVGGIIGKVKGLFSTLKGAGSVGRTVAGGMGQAQNAMSSFAKNILGVGAGIALVAAGFWLLSDAAIRLANAGPEAAAAMALMVGGIAALMLIAGQIGPKLQACATGFLAFGASVLMVAAAMALMAYASIQMAGAGDMAVVSMAIMVGGIAGLMAIAGAMGPQMTAGAAGLIAFGAAMLMCGAAMLLISNAATQIGAAGTTAMAGLAVMIGGMAALMAIAGALGPALTAGAAGLLAFGAAMLLVSVSMLLLAQAAVMISDAGAGAGVAMAAMMAGIVAMAAACGALSPLLLAGAAALAAFGAAVLVVGAGLMLVAAAAQMGVNALTGLVALFPQLLADGASAATAIASLSAALLEFSVSAMAVGAGAAAAGIAVGLLAAALGLAAITAAPFSAIMEVVKAGVDSLAQSSPAAADGMQLLLSSASGATGKFGALAAEITPLAAVMLPFSGSAAAAGAAMALFAAGVIGAGAGVSLLSAGLTMATAALNMFKTAISAFAGTVTQLTTVGNQIANVFTRIGSAVTPAMTAFTTLAGTVVTSVSSFVLMTAALTAMTALCAALAATVTAAGAGFRTAASAVNAFANALLRIQKAVTAASNGLSKLPSAVMTAMNASAAAVRTGCTLILSIVTSSFLMIVNVVISAMNSFVNAIRAGMNNAASAARSGAQSIKSAIESVNLRSSGMQMMNGLIMGLNSMREKVVNTAKSIANEAARAVNNALKVKSPSRVMMETGRFTGEGLALGIESEKYRVDAAAKMLTAPLTEFTPTIQTGIASEPIMPMSAQSSPSMEITFSPQFTFNGSADEQQVKEAVALSFTEFERMMREYERKRSRLSFS